MCIDHHRESIVLARKFFFFFFQIVFLVVIDGSFLIRMHRFVCWDCRAQVFDIDTAFTDSSLKYHSN